MTPIFRELYFKATERFAFRHLTHISIWLYGRANYESLVYKLSGPTDHKLSSLLSSNYGFGRG